MATRFIPRFCYHSTVRSVLARFFPAGAAEARIDLELSPVTMDEEIASFSLVVDYRELSPILPSLFTWPSQVLGTRLKSMVTLLDGRTVQQSQEGAWAWFRLLDQGRLSAGPSADTQWLTLSFDGYRVVLQVRNVGLSSPSVTLMCERLVVPIRSNVIEHRPQISDLRTGLICADLFPTSCPTTPTIKYCYFPLR
ncbi:MULTISPECIES: type VI secretion IcmF C-terminal domain-containing protein [unclassified Pseudomonas]|uniref:type VI secretion IcmF C-terminal domain-containing protein n=1 Tax=unclassified Pseudomonas TaxID=196821 RepID=UPI000C86D6EF|nr:MULTISPECIES: type VI secretion IcmF C-terminal domain-containing protein [unclassified Pseudomonas]PMV25227.1 hypothetical protein C1X17_05765 [Pseudomonas sp. FW305-3-2-15-C-TSA2]PMV28949.1 hypothetical protein C1X22_12265 [Pseudomonas sp. DP16D-L5]PMV38944.1 hypothetical protein C1X21_12380 [Pseudomonas sp. FW305-3-2-15-A-LB2]PMV40979.1 hypothetical protein C1X16_25035 [Pseudomonas sp. FW305-3-2-15-C-R2A1]PMV50123.1 hypothetical protein C1X19_26920 [Pseudomonas sp. GW460-4]